MIQPLVLSLLLLCLMGCVTQSVKPLPPEAPPNVQALTAETKIEGAHKTSLELANDPTSDGSALVQFGLQAEGALARCNIDKSLLRMYLTPAVVVKCKWYQFGCKKAP